MSFINAGLNAIGLGYGIYSNEKNYQLQRENQKWQRQMVAESWNREDNATQRRVEDLKAAGINPLLAAGSAAQATQAPVKEAPQREIMDAQLGTMIMNMRQMRSQISHTDADTQRIKAEIDLKQRQQILSEKRFGWEQDIDTRDYTRGVHEFDTQHSTNVSQFNSRLMLDRQEFEDLRLLNDYRRGLINQQQLNEQFKRRGIAITNMQEKIDAHRMLVDLVYDLHAGNIGTGPEVKTDLVNAVRNLFGTSGLVNQISLRDLMRDLRGIFDELDRAHTTPGIITEPRRSE